MNLMIPMVAIRRVSIALAIGAVLWLPARAQENQVIYEARSRYQLITVRDTSNGYRQLIFDGKFDGTDAVQSEMNLSDHYELSLSYARHIMTALPLVEKPLRILVVGLGGACMQRYLHKLLPDATIETAELDPMIRDVATSYFFFKEDARQIVRLGDGRKFIEGSKDKYDIIFLDAFTAESIPYQLTTQEFLRAVKDHVAAGGVVCANLWDGTSDYLDILKTYSTVFPELRVVKCAFSGNAILVALPAKAGLTVQAWTSKAEAFEKAHPTGLDLPRLIERGASEALPVLTNARVLLDKDKD
jgi:spermidine synthase